MRTGIGRRRPHQLVVRVPVEHPDDVEMREAFDIEQSCLELGVDLDRPLLVVLRTAPFRDLFGRGVAAADHADREKRLVRRP